MCRAMSLPRSVFTTHMFGGENLDKCKECSLPWGNAVHSLCSFCAEPFFKGEKVVRVRGVGCWIDLHKTCALEVAKILPAVLSADNA